MAQISINGATRIYAILGDPIAQVKSPATFSRMFAEHGIDAVMIPLHAPTDRFEAIVPALKMAPNIDGLIFTVPLKARAVPFADRLGDTGARIGAINALRREADGTWTGDMYDGKGFVEGARRKGLTLEGRRVAQFGAGGAGSAIACELGASGAASITLVDPMASRSLALADRLQEEFPHCRFIAADKAPDDADMIVNASTVGMKPGDGLPGAIGNVDARTIIGDVINDEAPTALIRMAIERGCGYVTGLDMLKGQADALLKFFTQR